MFYLRLARYYGEAMLPGLLMAALAFAILFRWRQRRLAAQGLASGPLREGVLLLFWMFCGGLAMLTLTPWGFHWVTWLRYGVVSDSGHWFSLGTLNLIPFQTLELGARTRYTLFNFLGNLAMFLPFGFCVGLLWRGCTWKRALRVGLSVTGFIEAGQLLVGRACDVDDLLLNTLGVLGGYGLWRLLDGGTHGRFRLRCRKHRKRD